MAVAPLVLGLAFGVLAGVVRIRAWHQAVAHACPGVAVRYRDVVIAHLGGAGLNGIVPAHAGDAVKIGLLKRREPALPLGVLGGGMAAPAVLEALLTACVVAWAAWVGLLAPPPIARVPLPVLVALGGGAAVIAVVAARKAPGLLRDIRRGMGSLRRPRILLTRIAPWIVAGRVLRLAAVMCFMAAIGLPATVAGALLVTAILGGVGGGAASTPVRVAVLAATLPALVGAPVGVQTAAALVGTQFAASLVNLAISFVVVAVLLGTASPRRLVAHLRAAAATVRALPRPARGEVRG